MLTVDGEAGEVIRQAIDGRVLVKMRSHEVESGFAHDHRRQGATLPVEGRGVWLDLSQHAYSFDAV